MKWLLYDKEGVEVALKIWKEFGRMRKETEEIVDEEEEQREKELEWGWGQIEKM